MDPTGGPRQPSGRRPRSRGQKSAPQNPQLFDDTSGGQPPPQMGAPMAGYPPNTGFMTPGAPPLPPQGYGSPPGQPYMTPYPGPGYDQSGGSSYGQGQPDPSGGPQFQQYLNDPMANIAMQYGQSLAGQGKDLVHKNLEKYVSTSNLKYYFAVDTSYVGKKLGLLVFPYAHTDWSIKYNQDEPVAPRYEMNAPDLYIPVMAFVTYILMAGLCLGTQERFTPEMLGITASTALVWIVIEIMVLLFVMYILNVSTGLRYLDLLAYCGYKYVGMILSLLGGLLFQTMGYYLVLLWTSISIAFFLVRSLKLAIIPHNDSESFTRGNKRRLYTLLVIALSQPVFMWWLSAHLVNP